MGLDYSYVLLIDKEEKAKLWEHIQNNGEQEDIVYGNTCLSINFELDDSIFDYLKYTIRTDENLSVKNTFLFKKDHYPDFFPDENLGRIGCIFLHFYDSKIKDKVFVSFSAATSRMSILFQDSDSIKSWFLNLSKTLQSIVMFIDLEDQGLKCFSLDGAELDLFIGDKTEDENLMIKQIGLDYLEKSYLP